MKERLKLHIKLHILYQIELLYNLRHINHRMMQCYFAMCLLLFTMWKTIKRNVLSQTPLGSGNEYRHTREILRAWSNPLLPSTGTSLKTLKERWSKCLVQKETNEEILNKTRNKQKFHTQHILHILLWKLS